MGCSADLILHSKQVLESAPFSFVLIVSRHSTIPLVAVA